MSKNRHFLGFLILWIPFLPILAAGRTFINGDCAIFEVPPITYLYRHWGEDWYPWSNGGMPIVAHLVGRLQYLPQLFFALFPPQKFVLHYFLLHQLLAFFAAYVYLTHRKFAATPVLLGALTYAGSSAVIQFSPNLVFLPGLASAPLLLYLLERMQSRPGPLISLGLSFLLAMLVSGGGWQVSAIIGCNLVLLLATERFWSRREGLPGRAFWLWLGVAISLAFLYWMPTFFSLRDHYATGPVRSTPFTPEWGGRFGVSDQLPLQTIYPLFYGPLAELAQRVQHANHEFVAIVGAAFLPLFLAGLAPLPQRRRWMVLWVGVLLIDFFFSFGYDNPVYRFFQAAIPGLNKFRGPIRILAPFPLMTMSAVACGTERLQQRKSWLCLVSLGYYAIFLNWGRSEFFPGHALLLTSTLCAIAYCRQRGSRQTVALLLAAVCQVSAPVLLVEQEFYSNDSVCIQETNLLADLKKGLANPLVGAFYAINPETTAMSDVRNATGSNVMMSRTYAEYLFCALFGREMTPEEFQQLLWQNFNPAGLLRTQAIEPGRWSTPMLEMLSLQFLALPQGVNRLQPRFNGFWVARSSTVEPDSVRARARLNASGYDPQAQILLDQPGPGDPAYAPGSPLLESYSPSNFSLQLNGASGWLVFSSLYYPGWSARLDGKPVVICRANTIFLAVPVPPKSNTLELSFVDQGFRSHLWGPGLALAGWCCLAWLGWKHSGMVKTEGAEQELSKTT